MDFVVNCYERTYRDVLAPGFVKGLVGQQRRHFDAVTVLINNVDDRPAAEKLGAALLERGEATRVEFVADHLSSALQRCGLSRRSIRRLPHFTDCCLVAVCLDGPEWLVYWDADAALQQPADWVTPTLSYMREHADVAIGNPNNWHPGLSEQEALHIDGQMAVGYGFSDVAFLARRADLAAPIYRKVAPASWRYPLAPVEAIFEQRVDAWMRRSGARRVTFLPVTVTHPPEVGRNYPRLGLRARARAKSLRSVARLASALSSHPALRAW